jgi:putative nucleotidyltransferase with HDIG domain
MKSQVYVTSVSAAGLLVVGHCISMVIQQPLNPSWIALAVLTIFTGALTIRVPSVSARLSVSETFVFASVLLFGPPAGALTVAVDVLTSFAVLGRRQRTHPQKILFNVASAALSIWIAGHAFYAVAGVPPLAQSNAEVHDLIVPVAVLAVSYFLLNSSFIAIAVGLASGKSPFAIWRVNLLGLISNFFAGASLAALFVSYTRNIDLVAISIIVPLIFISYVTFKTSLGRIEDATKHVDQMKRLYLSTIETMATAIDAKDQVTHGHIRRVQQFALGLAREVGVRDEAQMQALEAAALLHDTGKLVIPEHILNKPGKLTRGEFERMKTHASVGADILSSIDFPFPVVPIVRHHHENWDGTGYPDGLRGTDIPIGARILSVVDCFDALTSDRPYRPAMSTDEALRILMQRRGTMYDPLIVDTFAASWEKFAANIPADSAEDVTLPATVSNPSEMSSGLTLGDTVRHTDQLDATLDEVLRQSSADLAILFAIDRETDRITSVGVSTPEGPIRTSVTMSLGSGVSGWVAVNSSTIVNADPVLDLRHIATGGQMARIICVPVRQKGETVGVLSVYSREARGFSDDDRALIEQKAAVFEAESGTASFGAVVRRRKALTESASPTIH